MFDILNSQDKIYRIAVITPGYTDTSGLWVREITKNLELDGNVQSATEMDLQYVEQGIIE